MTGDGPGEGEDAVLLRVARSAFAPEKPERVGVAVSGGGDSMALLHLLVRAAPEAGLRVEAVTVDHGLRPEAASEARFVETACARLGVRHDIVRWTGWDGQGNLQAAARAARYRLLSEWATERGVEMIALGHTQDDNVESFVMGLSRGAGLDGLTGMRPRFTRGSVTFVRPLLDVTRDRLREYLRAHAVGWIDDPSNEDESFDRVRIRKALLAAGVDQAQIARSIDNLRRTRAGIDEMLARWAGEHVVEDRGDLVIAPDAFAALPEELRRRLLNAALRWVAAADYPPRAESVLRLVGAEVGPGGQTVHGCLVRADARGLVIGREPEAAARSPSVAADAVWDGRWRLEGPRSPGFEVRALGESGLRLCEDWRETGLPRVSLLASPSVWDGERLVAAPLAGRAGGWRASIVRSFATTFGAH